MSKFHFLALSLLLSLALLGQTSQPVITGSCKIGGAYPSCDGGEILFSGSNFTGQVHVQVTNSSGSTIDDGYYTTSNGILRFVENLSFAGTYTITVNDKTALTVTTQ